MKVITSTIWILSLVSLFTDTGSEMLYPIMPIYLQSIGFSVVLIGMLEGLAEATAGFSKGYFGNWSDNSGRRAPFVQMGYALSAISKPLMALFTAPLWIFGVRTIDRLGKGVRTAARDAILSGESTPQNKGKIFGFHRSMDTVGAVLGPLLALIYLQYHPQQYKTLFLIAFAPGVLAVISAMLIKDKGAKPVQRQRVSFFAFLGYWKQSPAAYRKLAGGLLIFTLFNSSDVFLLLRAKSAGLNDQSVILVYIFYNLVYALAAFPIGIIADRVGLKRTLLTGLVLFAITYFGMAIPGSRYYYFALFFTYGLYAAATEGISKAWISNMVSNTHVATAIGTFAAFQSICALLASSIAGLLWYSLGPAVTFSITGVVAIAVVVYLARLPYQPGITVK